MVYIEGYEGRRGPNPPWWSGLLIIPTVILWAVLNSLYDWIVDHLTYRILAGALLAVLCVAIVFAVHCLPTTMRARSLAAGQSILGLSTILTAAIKVGVEWQGACVMAAGGALALGKGIHDWRKEKR